MSAVTDVQTGPWTPEVLAYAAKFEVADYLEPLRQATLQLFPTAASLRVYLEDDPEIRDLTFLVFEVQVPKCDLPDPCGAKRRWNEEFFRIHTQPRQCPFVLSLLAVKP